MTPGAMLYCHHEWTSPYLNHLQLKYPRRLLRKAVSNQRCKTCVPKNTSTP